MFSVAQTSAVLTAAIELDVFAPLARGPLTAHEVAKKIGAPSRSTRILLDALAVIDPAMLTYDASRYSLTEVAKHHLVPSYPWYIGGFALSPAQLEGLARLAAAVKNDGAMVDEHALLPGNPHWENSARSLDLMSEPGARQLAQWLGPWIKPRGAHRVLDLACGSGTNGLALAAEHAQGHVTLLDSLNVLKSTHPAQKRFAIPDARVTRRDGDLHKVDFGGPFDIIVLSHILHFFDRLTCQAVAKRVAAALAPDGRVVLNERLANDLTDKDAVMFSIEMLSWSPTGQAYAKTDYDEWFGVAGLTKSEVSKLNPSHFSYQRGN
jgi:C-methyltransferase